MSKWYGGCQNEQLSLQKKAGFKQLSVHVYKSVLYHRLSKEWHPLRTEVRKTMTILIINPKIDS